MKEIIGALIGLAGGFIPDIFRLKKDKEDKKHELEILKLQIEQQKLLGNQRLEEIINAGQLQADSQVYQYAPVYKPEPKTKFETVLMTLVYAFNTLVRPVVTYLFVGLYIWVKYAQYKVIALTATNTFEAIVRLWTDTDAGFVAMVVMFWFGGRQIARSMGKIK